MNQKTRAKDGRAGAELRENAGGGGGEQGLAGRRRGRPGRADHAAQSHERF